MILRMIGMGLLAQAALGVAALGALAAGGTAVAVLACAAKRRAESKAAWPPEEPKAPDLAE
jgi:hypothetical protein